MRLSTDDRDVLYRAVVLDLSGLDDMHKALEQRQGAEALEYRQRFEHDWALLDAIGWDPDKPRLDLELDEGAIRAARYLEREAAGCLADTSAALRRPRHPMDPEDANDHLHEWADENLDLRAVCRRILDRE